MKVINKYNNPLKIPDNISDNFDYGLELGDTYIVMGVLTFKGSDDLYVLVDASGKPSWFPIQIFEIIDNTLPNNWYCKVSNNDENCDYCFLMGFEELCNIDEFYCQLLERNEYAMTIYFKRKIEYENYLKDLGYLP